MRTSRLQALLCSVVAALVMSGAAYAQDEPLRETPTPMMDVLILLELGAESIPTDDLATAFANWRESIAEDPEMQVVAVAIEDVEAALLAQPFEEGRLIEALEQLALELRAEAGSTDEDLAVELASLLSQTAALFEGDDLAYEPRLEVNVP